MKVTHIDQKVAMDLVTCSPDGLAAIDRDLTYVAWNSALSNISGVSAKEGIGKKVFELFPFLENVGEREVHRRVFSGESVVTDPRPYDIPSKSKVGHFQGHYWPWRNEEGEIIGLFMAIRDVGPSFNRLLYLSELSSALSQTTTPQQTLDITLDFLKRSTGAERGLVVMLIDNKQAIEVVALNNAGLSIGQRERLSVEHEIPLTLAMRENRVVFSPDEVDAQNYSYRHRDYVKFTGDVAAAAVPLKVEGEIIGGIAVSYKKAQIFTEEDASYWTAASNLCAQSYTRAFQFEKERSARAAAEMQNKAKSRFLANLSHELRTPLTTIIGHAELIKNLITKSNDLPSELSEKLNKYIDRCFSQGVMLGRILEDVLDLTKIESGTIEIRKETVAVNEWLEEICAMTKQLTFGKPVKVKLEVDENTPKKIGTDSVRAKQILVNLIGNAAKFTDAGEIKIEAKGEFGSDPRNILNVRIVDTGIGIEPARHESIFDVFEKAKVTKRERGGQGLGLTIASQLAYALGGSVRLIESAKDKGSVFEVRLPDLGNFGNEIVSSSKTHIANQSLRGVRILVADDDPYILEYLTELLQSAGADVSSARDGAEAIELCLDQQPSVVILDLQMPLIDGFQAAAQIRDSVPDLPLIALSAHGLREHKELAKESGFVKFLVKPVDLSTLASTILSVTKK